MAPFRANVRRYRDCLMAAAITIGGLAIGATSAASISAYHESAHSSLLGQAYPDGVYHLDIRTRGDCAGNLTIRNSLDSTSSAALEGAIRVKLFSSEHEIRISGTASINPIGQLTSIVASLASSEARLELNASNIAPIVISIAAHSALGVKQYTLSAPGPVLVTKVASGWLVRAPGQTSHRQQLQASLRGLAERVGISITLADNQASCSAGRGVPLDFSPLVGADTASLMSWWSTFSDHVEVRDDRN